MTKEAKKSEKPMGKQDIKEKRFIRSKPKSNVEEKKESKIKTTGEILIEEQEMNEQEMLDLCKSAKQKEFTTNWIKTRYIPIRGQAYDYWSSIAAQFCKQHKIEFDEEEWGKEFAHAQTNLWPKYLQAGLNEMAL